MKYFLSHVFLVLGAFSFAQEEKQIDENALNESKNLTWEANKELSENNFITAEVDYRKAISKSDKNAAAPYNLGNAYYNKETYSEAFGRFKQAGEVAEDKPDKHRAYHNMGNVFMKRKEYQKAVEAYKEALRNDPTDEETRYNLALAKELLKKEQEQNDQNQDNKDQQDQNQDNKDEGDDKEKNKDQEQKDQDDKGDEGDEKKEDNKEGDGENKEEQKKQPDQGDKPEEQQQPRPSQLSKQQVQNLLEAMQNEEKKVQEKIDAKKVKGAKVKNEKDW
ncbi:tetratricopeptide repeat protein [Ulvibacterium marinum]|uniref:tetratricopeptide repeat protein n=1 Tax=Ulvibacterium marinum TaxID=2419782 RepID=UPI0024951B7C|nr:tetratricopeptide repeat protein [Ulvibacterium marinum]